MDLKNKEQRDRLLKEIIPNVHVLTESFRPGVMEKLGLSPEECHKVNKKLIYVRLSGYGQQVSSYKNLAGHDGNYLANTGIVNKFRRTARGSIPALPNNYLADFSYGSVYCFQQILAALISKKENVVIDSSLAHNTFYLSQLELLENRGKKIKDMTNYTKPHESVYQDKNGKQFVLKANSDLYTFGKNQNYSSDQGDNSKTLQDLYQIAFDQLTIEEIREKFGEVVELLTLEDVIVNQKGISPGLTVKNEQGVHQIQNVFDKQYKVWDSKAAFKPKL